MRPQPLLLLQLKKSLLFLTIYNILILILIFTLTLTSANKYPHILWRAQLPDSGTLSSLHGLRQGNGIVVSHGNDKLWTVSDDGYLYILDAWNGDVLVEVPPPPPPDDVMVIHVQSKSSLVVQHNYNKQKFDVGFYALIGLLEDNTERSWIVSVDEYGRRLWQKEIDGMVEGTPQFSKVDENVLYFTANSVINDGDDEVGTQNPAMKGTVYAFNIDTLELTSVSSSAGYPFTALSIDYSSSSDDESVELLYFADQWKFGYSRDDGILYQTRVELSSDILDTLPEMMVTPWQVIDGTSVTPPVIFDEGENFIVGAGGAQINGVRIRSNGEFANDYEIDLNRSDRNASAPIFSTPVVTSDGKQAFVSTWDSEIYEIDIEYEEINEKIRLNNESGDKYSSHTISSPLLSLDEEILFIMQSRKGELTALDVSDISSIEWQIDCHDIIHDDDDFCEDSVEAEMKISNNGAVLYYGTVFGELYAIQTMDLPPTQAPTTSSPTYTPPAPPVPPIPPSSPTDFTSINDVPTSSALHFSCQSVLFTVLPFSLLLVLTIDLV